MVEAICKEISLQKNYLYEKVETIYFGGGTPSVLSESELYGLLDACYNNFQIVEQAEITLEANPDDLTQENLNCWKKAGVNRLSIGIQSFHDPHLQLLNRTHSGKEALDGVKRAQDRGLADISIDLIYGIPAESHAIWEKDVELAMGLKVPHFSAYCLTIEERTVFGNWAKKGKFQPVSEQFEIEQLDHLLSALAQNGYEQYEISNFSLPQKYSRHNTAYWQQKPYLGVGPGAHSYNRKSRQFNVRNNARYIKALSENELPFEVEELRRENQINEYIMTGLRTKWGIDLAYLKSQWKYDLAKEQSALLTVWRGEGWSFMDNQRLILTPKGKLLADSLAAELFLET